EPSRARGAEPALSFKSGGADGFAQELQAALREDTLFQAWRAMQDDPDEVDEALGITDPAAVVVGKQEDLKIELHATTSISSGILKQRLNWLAGEHWVLADVRNP
ncbi:MAG TPA: hypothetical protein VFY00_00220, partial [Arenimonas sp.]|nr:hypothetical protein [Arenimonas sp.]